MWGETGSIYHTPTLIAKSYTHVNEDIQHTSTSKLVFHLKNIIPSIVCVCALNIKMLFFINLMDFIYCIRSIDFAKPNGNIALVPRLETVDIPEAFAVPVTVIMFVVTI